MVTLNLGTVNHLQKALVRENSIYNRSMQELAEERTADNLYLANASEAREQARKYEKAAKSNMIQLENIRGTKAKIKDVLATAITLENDAADPHMEIAHLHNRVATFIADTLVIAPELNAATIVTKTTFDGNAGSVIDNTGTIEVGSVKINGFITGYGAATAVDVATFTATNLATDSVTAATHTVQLNSLITSIREAINKVEAAEISLLALIQEQGINKDTKISQSEIYLHVDKPDLQREANRSSTITSNIEMLIH